MSNYLVSHRFVDGGESRSGWDTRLCRIEVAGGTQSILEAACDYLIELVPALGREVEADSDRMFPIEFHFPGSLILSERSFWRLVAERLTNADEFVATYIDALARLPAAFYHDEHAACGANAVFSRLDVLAENYDSGTPAFSRAFLTYLRSLCDLDHEVQEDHYISLALNLLESQSFENHVALLGTRLGYGQNARRSFSYLRRYLRPTPRPENAVLRPLLEYLAADKNAYAPASEVLELLAVVYGSDMSPTLEVISQLAGADNPEFARLLEAPSPRILSFRQQTDWEMIEKAPWSGLHSGYHEFDPAQGSWLPLRTS
ncbi:MAG: hypothetical protein AAGE43_12170 [Pseudomonadota bacterium]